MGGVGRRLVGLYVVYAERMMRSEPQFCDSRGKGQGGKHLSYGYIYNDSRTSSNNIILKPGIASLGREDKANTIIRL